MNALRSVQMPAQRRRPARNQLRWRRPRLERLAPDRAAWYPVTGMSPGSKHHESPLMQVVQIASALGVPAVADEAFELADRVGDGRFFMACVGQYKRGKSTFLNALLGEGILPVGIAPV